MWSNSSFTEPCSPDDQLCITREHLQDVIIVPTLLLLGTLLTLVYLCLRHYCQQHRPPPVAVDTSHRQKHRHKHRQHLQGIDAPPGLNALEHEEVPMSTRALQANVKPRLTAPPDVSAERCSETFTQVTALPLSFSLRTNQTVSVFRGRMEDRDVVLRVLKDSSEEENFLGFASFVSGLGPHPFLPVMLGVVRTHPPLMMVMEELHHRELLGFLWRCRQDNIVGASPCDLTEKRIFIMAAQVASALDYLHSKGHIHGNIGARSVLVAGDLTAKLWGLGSLYRRTTGAGTLVEVDNLELRKWQAPEVLARRALSRSSDVWSFGLLLYEMVTLGEPPFAELMATELLQNLQRGKHLKRPATCSNTLYGIIRCCSDWSPHHRPTVTELLRKLEAGERTANGRTVLRVSEPLDIARYLREAGFGEAYNYAVL